MLLAVVMKACKEAAVGTDYDFSAIHNTLTELARWPETGANRIIGACARLVTPVASAAVGVGLPWCLPLLLHVHAFLLFSVIQTVASLLPCKCLSCLWRRCVRPCNGACCM